MKKTLFGWLLTAALWGPGFVALAKAQSAAPATIRRVNVLNTGSNFELEIYASSPVVPQTQVVAGPDRIVVDFPQALPGPGLRPLIVKVGAVKGIRMGLFQSSPPITRVVLDLKSPQAFRVFPAGRNVIVKLMPDGKIIRPDPSAGAQPAPTMVASNATPAAAVPPPVTPVAPVAPAPHVQVEFSQGNLKIWADRASLAEVLREIQRVTGAKVTYPPRADQELVVADLGPAPARQVLTTLLHGSPYNIIILGSQGDLAKLTAIVLTARGSAADIPLNYTPASVVEANTDAQPEPPPPVQEVPPDPLPSSDPTPQQ